MRYARGLQLAASEPIGRGANREDRRRLRYLQESAVKLSAAACADNPVLAIEGLAKKYTAEHEKGTEQVEAAEMLSKACRALARGQAPDPITAITQD